MNGDPSTAPVQVTREGLSFGMVDAAVVRNPSLNAQAVRAYTVLATYSDAHRESFPTRATIAGDMGCSLDTLDRALRSLTAAGVLEVRERRGDKGEQRSSVYVLLDLRQPGGGRMGNPGGGRTRAAGGGRTRAAHNKTTDNYTTKNPDAAASETLLPGIDAEPEEPAKRLAEWWWERQEPRPAGKGAWWATLGAIRAVIDAGHTPAAVGQALKVTAPPLSVARLEFALNRGREQAAQNGAQVDRMREAWAANADRMMAGGYTGNDERKALL